MPLRALIADAASSLLPSSGNSQKSHSVSSTVTTTNHHVNASEPTSMVTALSTSTASNGSLPEMRSSRATSVHGMSSVNNGSRTLATSKVTCLRKKHRSPRGVNIGELRLTDVALFFKADYMEIAPCDARITLPLINITMTRMSSYRRMFPYAIHVRSRGHPDFLFAFACPRDQLTFQQHLQLAIHDANASLTSTSIINRQNNDYPFPPALDDHRRISQDSLFSSEDHDHDDHHHSQFPHSRSTQPRSFPAAKIVNLASLSRNFQDDHQRCVTKPSSSLTRSKSHPGHSSSSFLQPTESRTNSNPQQLDGLPENRSKSVMPLLTISDVKTIASPDKPDSKSKQPICIDLNSPSIRNHIANRRSIDALIFLASLALILFLLMALFISFNQLRLRLVLLDNLASTRF